MQLTFRDVSSAPNVALATTLKNSLTLFHPIPVMFEANVAQRQVPLFLLPRIQRNVQLRQPQQLHSPRQTPRQQILLEHQLRILLQILLPNQHHRRLRSLMPLLLR